MQKTKLQVIPDQLINLTEISNIRLLYLWVLKVDMTADQKKFVLENLSRLGGQIREMQFQLNALKNYENT